MPNVTAGIRTVRNAPATAPVRKAAHTPMKMQDFRSNPACGSPAIKANAPSDRLAKITCYHHRAVGRAFHSGEDRGLHGGDHGDAERARNLGHAIVQDADEDQHPDLDDEADPTGPVAGRAA